MRIAIASCGLLLFLSTSQLLSQQSKANSEPPISLKLTTDSNPIKVGVEVKITVTVKNETQESIVIADGTPEEIYKVDVRDNMGKPVPERQRLHILISLGPLTLAPGETHQDEILLGHMYDLSRPGTYLVLVGRNSRYEPESGTENVRSNILVINVTETEPSDPPPLDQKVQKFELDDGALIDGVSELSRNPDVKLHIGLEEIIRKSVMDPTDRSVHFSLHLESDGFFVAAQTSPGGFDGGIGKLSLFGSVAQE